MQFVSSFVVHPEKILHCYDHTVKKIMIPLLCKAVVLCLKNSNYLANYIIQKDQFLGTIYQNLILLRKIVMKNET